MFIRNAWYVAAWEHEIGREPLRRMIMNEPIVFYRQENGKAVALEDRCCHRQAPLSMGRLIGDVIECPYHGLQFDTTGAGVKIPSQDRIPPAARVKAYPIVERYRWIWVWMGDPSIADPALIEDFHWLDDSSWGFGGNYLHVEADYLLLVENLLDTTHLPFLHPTTLGTDAFARSEFKVTVDGKHVKVARWLMDQPPAPFHKQLGGLPDGNVDRWQIAHYSPPSFVKLDVGSAPVGSGAAQGNRDKGISMWALNGITPETDKTAHYFFAQAYNFKVDQRWMQDLARNLIMKAFLEDMQMLKAQQLNRDVGGLSSPAMMLGQDKAWFAMRQIVQGLMADQGHQTK